MDEHLVNTVREFPALYDKAELGFKDPKTKLNCWKQVAEICGITVETAQHRWVRLRDKYGKTKKRLKCFTDGEIDTPPNPWGLMDLLSFLEPHVQSRRRSSYYATSNDIDANSHKTERENSDLTAMEVTLEPLKRKKLRPIRTNKNNRTHSFLDGGYSSYIKSDNDGLETFMQSMTAKIRKLEPKKASEVQLQIMHLVHQAQFESSVETNCPSPSNIEEMN